MPLVHVYTRRKFFEPVSGRHSLKVFAERLTEIAARALTVPGTKGALTSADVEVRVEEFGEFDVFNSDVAIVVLANMYEERLANLEERRIQFEQEVVSLLREQQKMLLSSFPGVRISSPRRISIWFPLALGGAYREVDL